MQLCISARCKFDDAFEVFKDWLIPIDYPSNIVSILNRSELIISFPEVALTLLSKVIDDPVYVPLSLNECLTQISQAKPHLKKDSQYKKLNEYARKQQ